MPLAGFPARYTTAFALPGSSGQPSKSYSSPRPGLPSGRTCFDLAGEIGDEDTSLVERDEERAERFGDYRDKREADAERAHAAVAQIADAIPLGQPILVGHHSEKRARKDAERIENGMRKAVKMWQTSKYWTDRAAGAIRHAKYKEFPAVRARRIKGLEADYRKQTKSKAEAERWLKRWNQDGLNLEQARQFANYGSFTVLRDEAHPYGWTAWDVLRPMRSATRAAPVGRWDRCRKPPSGSIRASSTARPAG